jgi:O-6-methylguanine DNA methyltransferase
VNPAPPPPCAATLATTWGPLRIVARDDALIACELPDADDADDGLPPFRLLREALPPRAPSILGSALAFARAMLDGRAPGPCPPLHPGIFRDASPFAAAVWHALRRIPRGRTATYGDVARAVHRPRAARGSGGPNPLPLFIPCHRVLAAGGALGGFSSGLAWKRLLLRAEGVSA